jgi:hypothetical protein
MVETRLQKQRRQMENFRQDSTFSVNNPPQDPSWTFYDPFTNQDNQPPINNAFKLYLQRDENGQILQENIEALIQDPEAYQFAETIARHDRDRFVAMLLSEGANLPPGFDINALNLTLHDPNANNTNTISHSSQPQHMMDNNFFDATTIIQATSDILNTSNTINATSNGGLESTTMPTTSMILSQSVGTTFGSSTMWAKYSNPLFTTTINAMGASSSHNNPPLKNPCTSTNTTLTHPSSSISQNPLRGAQGCIFIQGQQQNVNTTT